MKTVVSVERLSKRYYVGRAQGRDHPSTFREAVTQTAKRWLSLGTEPAAGAAAAEFWALREVTFSLAEGTRLGIIGQNGAGKSTLLKILARITAPSEGTVRLRGRTASLLEVGTGFHPELTGRENIFFNGALLGMSRAEIRRKMEQIIDFSGVEQFLDTPVKHYSSGMYVRLAFAVAAHVDPDILILDEVLAVGDLQFQRKCFGKMAELGEAARSVIFVSHDLTAIASLCNRCILLDSGRVAFDGPPSEAIQRYYRRTGTMREENAPRTGDEHAELFDVEVLTSDGKQTFEIEIGEPFRVAMRYRLRGDLQAPAVPNFHFFRADGVCAFIAQAPGIKPMPRGDYVAEVTIPGHLLNEGAYSIGFALTTYFKSYYKVNFYERNKVIINIRDPRDDSTLRYGYAGEFLGVIRPLFDWTIEQFDAEKWKQS